MLLNSIKYHNFRPFYGDQEIVFRNPGDDPSKNVVVILGENTYGKSTIILSFIWCLYGENRFGQKDLLNMQIQREMSSGDTETAWVEVNFNDSGKEYTLRRTQSFYMSSNGLQTNENNAEPSLTYVDSNTGETRKPQHTYEVETIINSILPNDLASFFFFQGEKSDEITRKDMGSAVKTLLGIETYDKMRNHLYGSKSQSTPYSSSVMGMYLEKQKDASGDKAKEEYEKIKEAEKGLNIVDGRLHEIEDEIQKYQSDIEEATAALLHAAPTKEIQDNLGTIREALKRENEYLEKNTKQFINIFGTESLPVLMIPFMKKAEQRLKELDISDKGIKGIEASAIYELLKRGVCLCGTDLKEGTSAYKNVMQYIDYLPPKNVGTLISEMKEAIVDYAERAQSFADEFENVYTSIQTNYMNIDDYEEKEKNLLNRIKEIGNTDTSIAELKLSNAKLKLEDLDAEKESKIAEKSRLETAKETATNRFNEAKSKNEKVKKYQRYYKYAEAIYEWVDKNYSEKEAIMRKRLTEHIEALFNDMYSGHRDISIDDKYNIQLRYKGGKLDVTGGLRVIQYFAYVGGLVKLAYEVMIERENEEKNNDGIFGEQYPLVLDAAFSNADQNHVVAIARELSKATTQLIFAVMGKDWNYAKDGLTGKISRMYELEKINEEHVEIKEVNA